jgi:hypothetical protein
MTRSWMRRTVLLALAVALVAGGYFSFARQIPFDPAGWRTGRGFASFSIRRRMINDLTGRVLRKGQTLEEIDALLGPGDELDATNNWGVKLPPLRPGDKTYFWNASIGPSSLGHSFLFLRFEKSGRLRDWVFEVW